MSLLGLKGKDVITGFEGIITGDVSYLTGCRRLLIAPPSDNGAMRESHWFDIDCIEILNNERIALPISEGAETPGFGKQAPKR